MQLFNRLLHTLSRMGSQQLQYPHILFRSSWTTMPVFQTLSQRIEHRWQLPLSVDIRVIQRSRTTRQCRQIMQWIEYLFPFFIASGMRCHNSILKHNFNTIHVPLDGDRLKRTLPRHAVVHVIKPHKLILVHFRLPANAGIEAVFRQPGSLLPLLL